MDQIKLAEFAKNSENKEGAEFTTAVQEAGIEQGSLIVSRLYNTMLGDITRVMRSWNTELVNVLQAAGLTPTALTNEQLLSAVIQLIKKNSGGTQLGDLIPNIGTTSPVGRVLCNGARITNCKTLFPDFYEYVLNSTPYKTVAEFNTQVDTYGQCGFCAVEGDDIIVPLITRPISGVTNLNQTGQAIMDTMRPIKFSVSDYPNVGGEGRYPQTTGCAEVVSQGVWNGGLEDWAGRGILRVDSSKLGSRFSGSETRGKQVQYPYYIQVYTAPSSQALVNTAELVDMLKYQNQVGLTALTQTSGDITLASGGLYTLTLSGDANFILPTPQDKSLLNQILVQLDITAGTITVNWGTTHYFSGTPTTSLGHYNIIWEYDNLIDAWVVGQIEKVQL